MDVEPAQCAAHLQNGRLCGGAGVQELVPGVVLCVRHYDMAIARLRNDERDRRVEFRLAEERLSRLRRVKPSFKKETSGAWSFSVGLPNFDGGPTRRLRRRGFKTKRDAEAEARRVLTAFAGSLLLSVEAFEAAIRSEFAAYTERLEKAKRAEAERLPLTAAAARAQQRARFVYYVKRPDGAIKIGTTWNIKSRMQTFLNVSPVELLAIHSGGQPAEAALHRRFRALRLDGEWFQPGPDLLAHIQHVAHRAERKSTTVAA